MRCTSSPGLSGMFRNGAGWRPFCRPRCAARRIAARGSPFRTAPDLASELKSERVVARKLSRAAVETLAIVAYHQPATRAEIEAIRGVTLARGTLDRLMEAGWVRPLGRRASPGRPLNWVTTPAFLAHFGLDRLDELPRIDELRAAGLLDIRPPGLSGRRRLGTAGGAAAAFDGRT